MGLALTCNNHRQKWVILNLPGKRGPGVKLFDFTLKYLSSKVLKKRVDNMKK
jgi:hypothetical protein